MRLLLMGDCGGRYVDLAQLYVKTVASDFTNQSTDLTGISDLSLTVIAGHTYVFQMELYTANTVANNGVKVDFDGGNSVMGAFIANGYALDTAPATMGQITSLTGTMVHANLGTDARLDVTGTFTPSSGGTFIPRAADNSGGTGVLTVYAGSSLTLIDTSV